MENTDFLSSLRQELINTQNVRFKFTLQKLIFIISLLGVGTISKELNGTYIFKYLIYFVPFVSFMFDLYIIGENFGIRRIGNYIKYTDNLSKEEKYWEFILNMPRNVNRDLFAIHGNIYSTIISILLSSFLIFLPIEEGTKELAWNLSYLNIVWLCLVVIASCTSWIVYPVIMNKRLLNFQVRFNKNYSTWETKIKFEKEILSKFNGRTRKDFKQLQSEISSLYDEANNNHIDEDLKKSITPPSAKK